MYKTIPIDLPQTKIGQFCQQHYIRKLSLFGSVLRSDFTPSSDIDILVEFHPDRTPGFFQLTTMQDELSQLLARTVDLRTPSELSNYFRDRVLAEAMTIYDNH
jgi:uncharacterized protein